MRFLKMRRKSGKERLEEEEPPLWEKAGKEFKDLLSDEERLKEFLRERAVIVKKERFSGGEWELLGFQINFPFFLEGDYGVRVFLSPRTEHKCIDALVGAGLQDSFFVQGVIHLKPEEVKVLVKALEEIGVRKKEVRGNGSKDREGF